MHSSVTGMLVAITLAMGGSAPAQESGDPDRDPAAEDETRSRYTLVSTVAFAISVPQGELDDRGFGNGLGMDASLLIGVRNWHMLAGVEVGYQTRDRESGRVALDPTRPDDLVDLTTRNQVVHFHAVLRWQPFDYWISPYADGLGGFRWFINTSEIEDPGSTGQPTYKFNASDATWSAGLGGGLQIGWLTGDLGAGVDLGARYLWGGEAQYASRGLILLNQSPRLLRSRTQMLVFYVGIYGRM
jgi:hypothetical protein